MVQYVASRHLLSLAPVPLTCPYCSLDTLSVAQDVPGSSCIFPAAALAFPFLQGALLPLGGEWYLETIVCAQVCSFDTGVTQVLCKCCASNHYTLLPLILCSSPGSPLIEIPRLGSQFCGTTTEYVHHHGLHLGSYSWFGFSWPLSFFFAPFQQRLHYYFNLPNFPSPKAAKDMPQNSCWPCYGQGRDRSSLTFAYLLNLAYCGGQGGMGSWWWRLKVT